MFRRYKLVQFLCQKPTGKNSCTSAKFQIKTTAAIVLTHCTSKNNDKKNPIEFPDTSQLSHQHLIQQACTVTVNSTCQLLTCTLVAILDIGEKYSKALKDHMSVLEESLIHLGNTAIQEASTDLITEARNNVDVFRRNFMELDSLMTYVEKLVNSATETSYLAGAETACLVLSERLHSAKTKINEQKEKIKLLERELVQLQKEVIKRTTNPEDKK